MKINSVQSTFKVISVFILSLFLSNFIYAQEPASQDSVVQNITVQDSIKQETPAKKTKKKKDSFKVFAGGSLSSLKVSPERFESNPQTGYLLGFSYKSGRFFYYEIGARYNHAMYQAINLTNYQTSSEESSTFNLNAIDFPIKFGLNLTSFADRLIGVRIFAGAVPSFTLQVGDNNMGFTKDDVNNFNIYGEGGIGIDVAFMFVEAGFNYGFNDMLLNDIQSNPQQFYVNLGFRF